MLLKNDFPILEFDTNPVAIINPEQLCWEKWKEDKMIITFFHEALETLKTEGVIEFAYHIDGENPFDIFRFTNSPDVLILLGQIGCPACAGNLDALQAHGIKKVMFCGGGGVLEKNIQVGQLLLVDGAIRDEGFSYHYVKPSRYIYTKKETTDKLAAYMEAHKVPFMRGLVWTTDAMLRETADRIEQRKAEGAKIVEMEQAGCIAVSQFRNFDYGAIIYGGDDIVSGEWDSRGWMTCKGVRYNLIMLCLELVKEI